MLNEVTIMKLYLFAALSKSDHETDEEDEEIDSSIGKCFVVQGNVRWGRIVLLSLPIGNGINIYFLIFSIEVPVFTKELHDVTASENDTVTLEVIVSGNSPYELEWFKNAVDVTESERVSLVKHDNGRFTLNIRNCEDDDTGEYCCVAQNEAGRVTCAGWLTVEGMLID